MEDPSISVPETSTEAAEHCSHLGGRTRSSMKQGEKKWEKTRIRSLYLVSPFILYPKETSARDQTSPMEYAPCRTQRRQSCIILLLRAEANLHPLAMQRREQVR